MIHSWFERKCNFRTEAERNFKAFWPFECEVTLFLGYTH